MRLWAVVVAVASAVDLAGMRAQLRAAAARKDAVNSTECYARLLTYEYALELQPDRAPMVEAFDALELEATCGVDRPEPNGTAVFPPTTPVVADAVVVAVDGDDSAAGTADAPFRTAARALEATRVDGGPSTILFRSGVHFLNETIALDARDAGLTLANYEAEEAWLSGGRPLATEWSAAPGFPDDANVYQTKIDADRVVGLHVVSPHKRFVRARFPNAGGSVGVETRWGVEQVASGDISSYGAPPVVPQAPQIYHRDPAYAASQSQNFDAYAAGRCETPGDPLCPCGAWRDVDASGNAVSESYWCSNSSGGGWSEMDQGNGFWHGPVLPTNVTLKNDSDLAGRVRRAWDATKASSEAVVTAWRAQGWFVNMYEVDGVSIDEATGDVTLAWSRGGFQGGRGWQVGDDDKKGTIDPLPPLYVENVLAELDEYDEWYFDNDTQTLYYAHNGTGAPPDDWTFVSPELARLVGVVGSQEAPVQNVTIRGLGFRDARITYLDDWGVPSGGDWALHRGAAVFLEGVEGASVEASKFERVDGNAVLVSGYARSVVLQNNEFAWVGDCAMAAWGRTDDWDATKGDFPRGTLVKNNYAHELGVYQLQSSMWFQAKTAETTLEGNVFFNGPRSAVNFNDGMGGGNVVKKNAIWNACRQSGDHGPINSWDRQAYFTDVRDPEGSWAPVVTTIAHNVIFANYGGSQGVDNDDGSAWYDIHHNFFYGEGLKMDYGGHDSTYHDNMNVVHPYDGQNCINVWAFDDTNQTGPCVEGPESSDDCDHAHHYYNNTCALLTDVADGYGTQQGVTCAADGGGFNPDAPARMAHMARNQYYTSNGSAFLQCPDKDHLASLALLQSGGIELGSTEGVLPDDDTLMGWARAAVGF
mmetsp:Transcript_23634/g.73009  ORF Transcript_23634/g.73009 Transcript_23634/m.73009 type:complete len:873 (+) Transcript_23634:238-2856(+)